MSEEDYDFLEEEFASAADEDSDFEPEQEPAAPPSIVRRKNNNNNSGIPERGLFPETRKFLLDKLDLGGGPAASPITQGNKLLDSIIEEFPNKLGDKETHPLLLKCVRSCAYHWKQNPDQLARARKKLSLVSYPSVFVADQPTVQSPPALSSRRRAPSVTPSSLSNLTPPKNPTTPKRTKLCSAQTKRRVCIDCTVQLLACL